MATFVRVIVRTGPLLHCQLLCILCSLFNFVPFMGALAAYLTMVQNYNSGSNAPSGMDGEFKIDGHSYKNATSCCKPEYEYFVLSCLSCK